MPSPRLLRHSRPCHPLRSAHLARCAAKTVRASFSTDGGDIAHSSPNSLHNAAHDVATQTTESVGEQQSLQQASLAKVALCDHQRAVPEPRTPSKPPTKIQLAEANADDVIGEGQETKSERNKESERRQRELVRPRANFSRTEGAVSLHKHVSGESQARKHTLKQYTQRLRQEKNIAEIQRQLQRLSQKVRNLRDVVVPPSEPTSIPVRGRMTSQPSSSAINTGLTGLWKVMKNGDMRPTLNPNVPVVNLQQFPVISQLDQPPAQPYTSPLPELYRRAWIEYRKSIHRLVFIANDLEGMSSRAASTIASFITQYLRKEAKDAIATNDYRTLANLGRYKWGLRTLLAGYDLAATVEARSQTQRTSSQAVVQDALPAEQPPNWPRATLLDIALSEPEERRESVRLPQNNSKATTGKTDLRMSKKKERGRIHDGSPQGWAKLKEGAGEKVNSQELTQQTHSQSRSMRLSDRLNMSKNAPTMSDDGSNTRSTYTILKDGDGEPSLLDELFPESSRPSQPLSSGKGNQYPKLDLPSMQSKRHALVVKPKTLKEQVVESFQKGGEQVTVLQMSHCSTELTEADFRRVIPKGKHIESWRQDGGLFKIIPGRDPLSLDRMPFYYILFKDSASALAYQKNASRLHRLSALHQPSSIFSAIPAPRGFLEAGEDLNAATSSYHLLPARHDLSLSIVMQPYNPALRALFERGGYQPIVPDTDSAGKRVWKVLFHIEGYEPTPTDLFKTFRDDAFKQGLPVLPLRNESRTSIHRLRDIINLKTNSKLVSSINPRAYGTFDQPDENESHVDYEDPGIQLLFAGADEDSSPRAIKQMVMNRVYNRWVVEFSDEDSAIQFASRWHRRILPDLFRNNTFSHHEDVRMCNTEVLW